MGPGANDSLIKLTLSSPNLEPIWCLLNEKATGSDHEVTVWKVLGNPHPRANMSAEMTGWDINGWDPMKVSEEEEKKKKEERKAKARDYYMGMVGWTLMVMDLM